MTEHDLVYDVDRLGIRYNLELSQPVTLKWKVAQVLRGNLVRRTPFWALRDVTFQVEQGDVLGVIGRNGSGKSSLLLALAGILRPDEGSITSSGSSILLTFGAGFEQDLTGRQNILLNAAYLGFTRDESEALVDPVIEFSELGEFIDAPLRQYSLGMRTRLGFSIAANVRPDILLVDEILGVGDFAFQAKSRAKLDDLMESARAIVIVSQSIPFVLELCNKVLWLDQGRAVAFGEPRAILRQYHDAMTDGLATGAVRAVS